MWDTQTEGQLDRSENMERNLYTLRMNEAIFLIRKNARAFISIALGSFILATLYSLSIDDEYQSTAVLAPRAGTSNLSNLVDRYGALASFAGVNLPNRQSADEISIALETIKSIDFYKKYIHQDFAAELYALDYWDKTNDKIVYNTSIFDSRKNSWVLTEESMDNDGLPFVEDVYPLYRAAVAAGRNLDSGFVTLSVIHISPRVARDLASHILSSVNTQLKSYEVEQAQSAIQFLLERRASNNLVKVDEIFSRLIEEQTKTIMLANIGENFLFHPIQEPNLPRYKMGPNRLMIILSGTCLGIAVYLLYLASMFYSKA